jgi:putative molybdopterin biosynthesis protein
MDEQIYTPQEVADILKVKKTTVYEMIRKGSLHAVKMGKQFRISHGDLQKVLSGPSGDLGGSAGARSTLSQYIPTIRSRETVASPANIIVCGQDFVLDMLCSSANSLLGGTRFLRSYAGSYDGLQALYKEEVQIASLHLWDRYSNTYNLPFVKTLVPGEPVCMFHVLERPVCIYTAAGNPKGISSIADFARPDISIVNRERGSGIRVLLDALLAEEGISSADINGYGRIVNSHLAAASIISRGGADCAIGAESAAVQFKNVSRVFLRNESYDIVFRKSDEKSLEMQSIIKILQSKNFREEVGSMGGYDVTGMGDRIL